MHTLASRSTYGNGNLPLLPHHLDELRASGLSDTTIAACGFRSETNKNVIARLLNRKRVKGTAALRFPFLRPDGTESDYARLKLDSPRLDRNGKPIKYESPVGQPNRPYIPPGTFAALNDPSIELILTEGEKKAAKADQEGFPCIGLVGVYGWKEARHERLIPDLDAISWKDRNVYLVFDSDVSEKPDVRDALSRLAAILQKSGAIVKVIYLPDAEDGSKVGLDDYLVAHAPTELRRLMDEADDPEPVSGGVAKDKASDLDPYPESRAFIRSTSNGDTRTLQYHRGEWYGFRQYRYQKIPDDQIKAALTRHLDHGVRGLTTTVINNILACTKAECIVDGTRDTPCWLTADVPFPASEILATRSGLLHLPSLVSGQEARVDPTPHFFSTVGLDYDVNVDASPPTAWLQFLQQLWGDDKESISLLREWFGYCLLPDTRQQKILLIIGPKRSGKGTIGRILHAMIGLDNVSAPRLSSLATNFGLWPLVGTTLAIVSDVRLSGRTDQAAVVESLLTISGEDAVTIDRKHRDPITTKLPTRFILMTNELPSLADVSGALAGRFLTLVLTESFYGREDPKLTDTLLEELPSILLWSIGGWKSLQDRGYFVQPESGRDAATEMEDLGSPVAAFLKQRCVIQAGCETECGLLFFEWKQWCDKHGRKHPGDEATFGRNLRAVLSKLKTQQRGTHPNKIRVYVGIRVR